MGLWDKIRNTASEVKAVAIVRKADYDLRQAGYKPDDYAGFDNEPETDNRERTE